MNTGSQYKKLCWKLDQMGAVGETALHVCLLNATSIHADLAKRLLKIYPNLINDIYISDEYYGKIGFCFSVLVEHVETCSVAEPGAGTGLGALAFFVSKFINNMVTTRFHFGRAVCHPISFYMGFFIFPYCLCFSLIKFWVCCRINLALLFSEGKVPSK